MYLIYYKIFSASEQIGLKYSALGVPKQWTLENLKNDPAIYVVLYKINWHNSDQW